MRAKQTKPPPAPAQLQSDALAHTAPSLGVVVPWDGPGGPVLLLASCKPRPGRRQINITAQNQATNRTVEGCRPWLRTEAALTQN